MKFLKTPDGKISCPDDNFEASCSIIDVLTKSNWIMKTDNAFNISIDEVDVSVKILVEQNDPSIPFTETVFFFYRYFYKNNLVYKDRNEVYFGGFNSLSRDEVLHEGLSTIFYELSSSDDFQNRLLEVKTQVEAKDLDKLVDKANNNKKKVSKI